MADYLNVYDLNRQKSAVLQNAFEITETQELNKIYTLDFKIPADDQKVQFLQPFHYVRYGDTGQLYRIIKTELEDSDTPILSVNCEHVITTLVDDLMFGVVNLGGGDVKTADVITELLKKQSTKNWTLAECDFIRRFEYNWEQENILNALYSIPKEFTKAYKWTFNTTKHPWELSLKAIDATIHPQYYIRAKRNLLSSGTAQDFAGICTRIYPLGYGEGVNQLTIKDATVDKNSVVKVTRNGKAININGTISTARDAIKYGNTYIESPSAIVAQYGIKEKVLVDRRFEDANSLFSYAQTMLDGLSTPSMSRSFDVVDLYPMTSQDIDSAEVGKICKMTGDDTIAYITKTERVLDEAGNLTIELSTKATDVASAIADLADRVRIESVYAQGATQLYQHSKDANASTTKGMVMSLYFPEEMRQINKVLMRLKLGKFRSYSKATDSKTVTMQSCTNETVTVNTCSNETVTVETNTKELTGITTTNDGGGTTSSSGGSTVTVGGGGSSGNGTDQMTTGLSLDVKVEGTVSAPMATQTSLPSTDTTSGTEWSNANYANVYILTQEKDLIIEENGGQESLENGSTEDQSSTLTSGPWDEYGQTERNYTSTPYEYYEDAGSHYHDMRKHTHFLSHSHTVSGSVNTYHGHNIKTSSRTGYNAYKYMYHDHAISLGELEHSHNINHYHTVSLGGGASGGYHTHTFSVPNHTHTISEHSHGLPSLSHSHTITLKGHDHKIVLDGHEHKIVLNGHSHEITPGIYEFGNPKSFTIKVSGVTKATVNTTSYNGDIVTWLLDPNTRQVPRNTWIDLEIIPNDLAYCQCSVFIQGFVQSRGGGNY